MKAIITIGIGILLGYIVTDQWKFVPDKAAVKFVIYNDKNETEAEGVLTGLKGGATFDSTKLAAASINASVDAKTINSGIELRDESLRSADFFEVEKYPSISFISEEITKEGNTYFAKGQLTIKDVSKRINIPFYINKEGNTKMILIGKFTINRLDFNVGTNGDGVGNKVELQLTIPVEK
jgi:polyisoprenoid-binding protein YceI